MSNKDTRGVSLVVFALVNWWKGHPQTWDSSAFKRIMDVKKKEN